MPKQKEIEHFHHKYNIPPRECATALNEAQLYEICNLALTSRANGESLEKVSIKKVFGEGITVNLHTTRHNKHTIMPANPS